MVVSLVDSRINNYELAGIEFGVSEHTKIMKSMLNRYSEVYSHYFPILQTELYNVMLSGNLFGNYNDPLDGFSESSYIYFNFLLLEECMKKNTIEEFVFKKN